MNKLEITNAIFSAAQTYASNEKVRFGPGAFEDIKEYASKAASDLAELPSEEQQGRIRATSLVFERLIDEMVIQSKAIPGYQAANPGVIGEDTLRRALSVLCPLWPFC
jgi:hypothetical protein